MSWLTNLGDAAQYAQTVNTLGPAYYVTGEAKEDLREQGKEDEARQIEKAEAIGTVGGAVAGLTLGNGIPALWKGIQAFRATHPIISGVIDAGLTIDGVRNALSDNGVKKTINYATDGNWGRAAASGTMDALDLLGGVGLIGDAVKGMRYLKQVPNFGNFLWDTTPNKQMAKRAVEGLMRQSPSFSPNLKKYINLLRTNKSARNYVLSGKLDPIEIAKGHFVDFPPSIAKACLFGDYNGTIYGIKGSKVEPNGIDYIDAFLYGSQQPSDKIQLVSVGNLDDFGPLKSYVQKYYPSKIKDIPVYDTGFGYKSIPQQDMSAIPLHQEKVSNIVRGTYPYQNNLQFPLYNFYINTGGHTVERGLLNGYPVIRGYDIWKFNPEDYLRKWSNVKTNNPVMSKWLMKLGTQYVDAMGTPIITRTKWDWLPKNLIDTSPYLTLLDDGFRSLHKSGGSIHIKKKNRGKFTDYCKGKVTEECIRKGKNSSNPTTRKRANFAWVARHKFKHEEGGTINYLNYFK